MRALKFVNCQWTNRTKQETKSLVSHISEKNTPGDTNTPILFRSLAGLTRRNVSSKAGPAGLVPLAELDGPGTPRVPPARAGDDDGCGTENVVFSPARSQNEDLLST